MAEHAHDLERVTRYGNGFSRFRCRFAGCDYWTDARDDEQTDELARLRAEVARLTQERDEVRKQLDTLEVYDREQHDALRALLRQLVGALRALLEESGWRTTRVSSAAREALAAAAPYLR